MNKSKILKSGVADVRAITAGDLRMDNVVNNFVNLAGLY